VSGDAALRSSNAYCCYTCKHITVGLCLFKVLQCLSVCVYVRTCVHVCVFACVFSSVSGDTDVRSSTAYLCVCTCVRVCVCVCVYVFVCVG